MDEDHLMAAARYVVLNPVRARLVATPEDWPWSSARAHLAGRDDGLVAVAPLLERCGGRFADLIAEEPDPAKIAALRAAETIGRPLGADAFLDRVAGLTGRDPRPGKRGRKSRAAQAVEEGAHRGRKKKRAAGPRASGAERVRTKSLFAWRTEREGNLESRMHHS